MTGDTFASGVGKQGKRKRVLTDGGAGGARVSVPVELCMNKFLACSLFGSPQRRPVPTGSRLGER